jgi:hypothetical protein
MSPRTAIQTIIADASIDHSAFLGTAIPTDDLLMIILRQQRAIKILGLELLKVMDSIDDLR